MNSLAIFLAENFYYVFLAFLGIYVYIRLKSKHSNDKRRVIFILLLGTFVIFSGATFVVNKTIPGWTLPIILTIALGATAFFVHKYWVFRMKCVECNEKMDWKTIITDDRNLCIECLAKLVDKEESEKAYSIEENEEETAEEISEKSSETEPVSAKRQSNTDTDSYSDSDSDSDSDSEE